VASQGRSRARRPARLGRAPLAERMACIQRFRAAWCAIDAWPPRMTARDRQADHDVAQRAQRPAGRIDFFLEQARRRTATETVFDEGGMTEQIQHMPLGVVANISAWNYPWFVGCNVIVPALLTGNAVLYKPSEYAV
jgi:acyl-CoA reductase-like NAD-dependent aldehyde dehydrogenase